MELHASDTKSEKITTQISGEPHSLVANNLDRSTGASPRPTTDQSGDDDDETFYLQGARYWAVSVLTAIMLFLVQIETTIVTTSLVAISHSIGGFEISSWVISSYLLGYVAAAVILTKFSDIFGRKPVFVLCIFVFTVFSGACAAAQTMTQLVILRAFQGAAGGGSQAIGTVMVIEVVPPHKYSKQVANTGLAIVLAMVLGPIVGGAISSNTTWRWIFLFNVPVGAVALALAVLGIPRGFPHHGRPAKKTTLRQSLARVDFLGCSLLFLATLTFTAAFQEAGSRFAWDSAYFITLLVVSVLLWVALLVWERRVTLADGVMEPVLPWRFLNNRAMAGILLGMVIIGGPLTVTSFQVPQRFQLINGLSTLNAAVRLVPYGAGVPVGTIVGANLAGKLQIPLVYLVMASVVFQVVGYALLGTLPTDTTIPPAAYAYLVIAGLGCGMCIQTLLLAIPFTTEKRDNALGLGTANQFRAMGASVTVAIVTAIFNGHVLSPLQELGIPSPASLINHQQDSSATAEFQRHLRQILSEAYNYQMLLLCACGAAQMVCVGLIWKKEQIKSAQK